MKKLEEIKTRGTEAEFNAYMQSLRALLPPRYREVNPDDLPLSLQEYCYSGKGDKNGLFLFGPAGTGKTHAAYAIALLARANRNSVRVENATELFYKIRRGFDSTENPFDVTELASDTGVLVIDDFGVEKLSDWVVETFYLIINSRYEQMLPTIFTSNYSLGEIAERYGDRIPSRIAEMCNVVELSGEDKRLG